MPDAPGDHSGPDSSVLLQPAGGRRPLSRRWLTSATLRTLATAGPAAVVLAIGAFSYRAHLQMRASRALVAHSRDVIDAAHQVLTDVLDAETGQRGFLLTGEERYLEPYNHGLAALRRDTVALRQLTQDDRPQQGRVDTLNALARRGVAVLDTIMALRRAAGPDAALAQFRLGKGKALMDSARAARDGIDAEETRLLTIRRAQEERDATRLAIILLGGAVLAGAFALFVDTTLGRLTARIAADERAATSQAHELARASELLGTQTVELEQANALLQEQAIELEAQQGELETTNQRLQEQQEALEVQAEELRAAVEHREKELAAREAAHLRLAESEARLRRIADAGIVGLFFWTIDGRIEEANDAFLTMLRYDRDDLAAGRVDWRHMTPPEYAEADVAALRELGATGAHRPFEKAYLGKDGRPVPVLIASAFFGESRERGVCVCVDISSQKVAEREREALLAAERAARERTERLQELAARLNSALTPADVARVTLMAGCRALGLVQGSVYMIDAQEPTMATQLQVVGYSADIAEQYRRLPVNAETIAGDALVRGEPVVVGRRAELAARYPALAPLVDAGILCGSAALPLFAADGTTRGHVIGFIGFDLREEHDFNKEEVRYLEVLAHLCSQALERARAFEAEQVARAEAEHANGAKAQFLTSMSHELRTPLNAIGGYADLIDMGLRGPVTDTQREDLARIKRSGQHLLSLINDILNYAKLEAGRVELRPSVVNIREMLAEVDPLIAPQIRDRRLVYRTEMVEDCSTWADGEKVQQVLVNLLTNAVKFTEAGATITVICDADRDQVRITVADTGRGIAAEKLARIFEPFIQVDRHLTHASQQGVGLGLTISRDLARAMGGDLTVQSTFGVGSAFTVTLPRSGGASEVGANGAALSGARAR